MAIAYDNSTSYAASNGVTVHTFAHTVTGANPIIFVGFMKYSTNGANPVVGVTYNGVAMALTSFTETASTSEYLYYLRGPATGANNVVITLTNPAFIYGGACSYTGVAQTGAIDSANGGNINGATSITVSTTTVKDNCWVVGVYGSQNGRVQTAGTNSTQRFTNSAAVSMYDTNAAQTPAGAHSLQVNLASSDIGALMVASFDPYVASGASAPPVLPITPSGGAAYGGAAMY